MTKEQLAVWLSDKKFGAVILICPRCNRIDIDPKKHLDQCDPAHEAYRMESEDNAWK